MADRALARRRYAAAVRILAAERLARNVAPAPSAGSGRSACKKIACHSPYHQLGIRRPGHCTIITYVTGYMTTYALNTLQVSAPLAFGTTLVNNTVGIAAALLGGWLADRAGRRHIIIWPQIAALLMTYPVFF